MIAIAINHAAHQREHGEAFRQGFERHGLKAVFVQGDTVLEDADFHVTWSIKRPQIFAWATRTGKHVLVAERGHVGDRMNWTSVGWDGLGNRGRYAQVNDGGERWNKHWQHLLQPWKVRGYPDQSALVLGQVSGDASLYQLKEGFQAWAQHQTNVLLKYGYRVRYRPHPLTRRQGIAWHPDHAALSVHERLVDDLAEATLAVSFNSTSGVEAVLAGVQTVVMDEGGMAWPISPHTVDGLMGEEWCDRTPWAHRLAWTQFALDEIRSGFAWDCVSQVMEVPI